MRDIFLFGKNLKLSNLFFYGTNAEHYFSLQYTEHHAVHIDKIGQAQIENEEPKQIYFPNDRKDTLGVVLEETEILEYYEGEEKEKLMRYVPEDVSFIHVGYGAASTPLLKRVLSGLSADTQLYVDNDRGTILPLEEFLQSFPV